MLVLSRKVGEIIHIGDNITVQVVEVRGNKVRVGILAPQEIVVLRGELWEEREEFKRKKGVEDANRPEAG